MEPGYTAEQERVRRAARRLARERLAPAAAALDAQEGFPAEALRALGREGLLGVGVAPEYGGLGAGATAYAAAVRELAAACAATTVAMMVTNMVAETIQRFGTDAQRRRFLPAILRGGEQPTASFSLSEPGSGSDAAGLRTTAVRDGDAYVLNGTKAWVTSGGHSGVYLVMARTGGSDVPKARGVSAFLVEAGTPGFDVGRHEDKTGLRGSATTQLVFEDCRVPAENRLGDEGEGFRIAMAALDGGRIGVSAQACGIATAALDAARRFGGAPSAAGGPCTTAEAALAGSAAELAAGWLLCRRAAALKDRGRPHSREAAMAKVWCTEMADRVCHRAVALHGAAGGTARHPVERLLRDVRVTRIYEGTSEIQRVVIARQVLKGVAA